MKKLFYLLLICLSGCTAKDFVDSFRASDMRGLTKCERHFKKAIKDCPSLIDSTTKTKDSSYVSKKDTSTIVNDVNRLDSSMIKQLNAYKDSLAQLRVDSSKGTIVEPQYNKQKVKYEEEMAEVEYKNMKAIDTTIVIDIKKEKCIEDTLFLKDKGVVVGVYQDKDGKVHIYVKHKDETINMPKAKDRWYNTPVFWLSMFGLALLILIFLLFRELIKRNAK